MSEREHSGAAAAPSGEAAVLPPGRWAWVRDWRVWFGMAISALCLWYAGRDVPFADLREAFRGVRVWQLVLLSVPGHIGSIYFRALRWRHLTDPITPVETAVLYRAQSIGFVINNLVPLRMGEFVRSWYLARETGTRGAAILGTVVLERVLDIVCVLLMAGAGMAWLGSAAGDGLLARGARLMLPVAFLPLVALALLRGAPDRVIGLVAWLVRPLPVRIGRFVEDNLRRFTQGLGALSGGTHLFWIFFHSLVIWLGVSALPIIAGLMAFGLDFGSPERTLTVAWILLAAVGVAVAIPSAPGFVGTYQFAFLAVLEPLGVPPARALALGLVVWALWWCTFTVQGLIVMRLGGTSLAELRAASGKDPTGARR